MVSFDWSNERSCVGFHQDIQKEGKTSQKDQAEQTYAQLVQIQDW